MHRGRFIDKGSSLIEALKKMDFLDKKLLLVFDHDHFIGLLSSGDIQRTIINNRPLSTSVFEVLRANLRLASIEDDFDAIRKMMLNYRMELCPVVDQNNELVNVYFWEDIFQGRKPEPKSSFVLPVVIMAGGFGTRLKPLTNVLPKPLIPIGDKSMLEEIFDRFSVYGCKDFFVSVNYKAELIKYYIGNLNLSINISYFAEPFPMGTAGSLSLLKGLITQTFFVSNCDILVDQDYSEILQYHIDNKNEITIVAALKHFPIEYGILETEENGKLLHLVEKPEIVLKINSGMYILEPHLIEEIPLNGFFHITQLISSIINRGGNIGVFPISDKSGKDVGNLADYSNYSKITFGT